MGGSPGSLAEALWVMKSPCASSSRSVSQEDREQEEEKFENRKCFRGDEAGRGAMKERIVII